MNKSEVTNLLERAKAVTQESPDEWTFEQWEPLARKHGFITFSGRNGFMDGYLVSYKKSKKITEAITRLAESYLEALEVIEEIKSHIDSFNHLKKRYYECYGEDAKIAFAKLSEVRAIDKCTSEFLKK